MDNDAAAIAELPEGLTPARLAALGFDLEGLTVRAYTAEDAAALSNWWSYRHAGEFPFALLPPLGVVVEDIWGPAGMLWCYESFGVGVAFLEHPVTRPGLSVKTAGEVMAMAVCSCVHLAGKSVEPMGQYGVFRVATPPAIARFLSRLGFKFCDWGTPQRGMILLNS